LAGLLWCQLLLMVLLLLLLQPAGVERDLLAWLCAR
jgi:hypothetical protein